MKDVARLLPTPEWNTADLERLARGTKQLVRRRLATKVAATCALCILGVGAIASRASSVAVTPASVALAFEDGTRVESEQRRAIKTESMTAEEVVVRSVAAHARFDVAPNRARRFVVLCDDVRVEVLGTIFTVDRTEAGVLVSVQEGKVRVVERNGARSELSDGEIYLAKPAAAEKQANPALVGVPSKAGSSANKAGVAGNKAGALDEAELALAQADYVSAERLLKAVQGPEAALASFMLGKLYQDRLSDPARALVAFERVSEQSPLAEDALHRQISCLRALHRDAEATLREQSYRAQYPNGVLLKR